MVSAPEVESETRQRAPLGRLDLSSRRDATERPSRSARGRPAVSGPFTLYRYGGQGLARSTQGSGGAEGRAAVQGPLTHRVMPHFMGLCPESSRHSSFSPERRRYLSACHITAYCRRPFQHHGPDFVLRTALHTHPSAPPPPCALCAKPFFRRRRRASASRPGSSAWERAGPPGTRRQRCGPVPCAITSAKRKRTRNRSAKRRSCAWIGLDRSKNRPSTS
jgi:hypothetical protein